MHTPCSLVGFVCLLYFAVVILEGRGGGVLVVLPALRCIHV